MSKESIDYSDNQVILKNKDLQEQLNKITGTLMGPWSKKKDLTEISNLYNKFVTDLDKAYSKEATALNPRLRKERDLLKYETICLIRDKFTGIGDPSPEIREMFDHLNNEAVKASNILSGHKEANQNITTSRDLPSLTDRIGKRNWMQFFGDFVRGDLHILQTMKETIYSTLGKITETKNTVKETFTPYAPTKEETLTPEEQNYKNAQTMNQWNIDAGKVPKSPSSPAPKAPPLPTEPAPTDLTATPPPLPKGPAPKGPAPKLPKAPAFRQNERTRRATMDTEHVRQ